MVELLFLLGISTIALFSIYLLLAKSLEGTKCITEPYRTKNGKVRTALRNRRNYIN
jgi:hypothetical protein